MVYIVCTLRLGSDDVAESFSWGVPGSMLACFPLMISTKWIAVQAKGIRYFPSLSQFATASVRILSLCWNDKKQDKIAFTVQLRDKRKRTCQTNAPFWRTRVQHARDCVRNAWVLPLLFMAMLGCNWDESSVPIPWHTLPAPFILFGFDQFSPFLQNQHFQFQFDPKN